jgi:hypothetical protein
MFKMLEYAALVFILIWRYFRCYHNIPLTIHTVQIISLAVEVKSEVWYSALFAMGVKNQQSVSKE